MRFDGARSTAEALDQVRDRPVPTILPRIVVDADGTRRALLPGDRGTTKRACAAEGPEPLYSSGGACPAEAVPDPAGTGAESPGRCARRSGRGGCHPDTWAGPPSACLRAQPGPGRPGRQVPRPWARLRVVPHADGDRAGRLAGRGRCATARRGWRRGHRPLCGSDAAGRRRRRTDGDRPRSAARTGPLPGRRPRSLAARRADFRPGAIRRRVSRHQPCLLRARGAAGVRLRGRAQRGSRCRRHGLRRSPEPKGRRRR